MRVQAGFLNPLHSRAIQRLGLAGEQRTEEKFQMHRFFGIGMGNFLEELADGNLHAQFFADLPNQALLEGFPGLALAAGKFPAPAQVRVRMPLGDEQSAAAKNEGGAHFNDA